MDPRFALPPDLPAPVDDGQAAHLTGLRLPRLALPATVGEPVALAALARAVIFVYPRTGLPEVEVGPEWDATPGARGCTPQACGFRDLHAEFARRGVSVYGLSTQDTAYQRAFAARNGIPFPLLSDATLRLTDTLILPTFQWDVEGLGGGGPPTLLKRMAWYVEGGVIRKVWYPVFPPDRCAAEVLGWLDAGGSRSLAAT